MAHGFCMSRVLCSLLEEEFEVGRDRERGGKREGKGREGGEMTQSLWDMLSSRCLWDTTVIGYGGLDL
jgi:hypothetical protein